MVAKKSGIRKLASPRRSGFTSSRSVFSTGLLVFLLVMGFLLVAANLKLFFKRKELGRQEQDIASQISRVSARQSELQKLAQDSKSEWYQEKILRERGLYKKPGEEVFTIIPQTEEEQKSRLQQEPAAQKRVWWDPLTW